MKNEQKQFQLLVKNQIKIQNQISYINQISHIPTPPFARSVQYSHTRHFGKIDFFYK